MRYKAKTMSKTGGYVDCGKLIEEGGCTIVAQFLRRVQEVIWNRQLMRMKDRRLGMVRDDASSGFQVCILYGCSVPVVLQKIRKQLPELKAELIDRYDQWYKQFYGKVETVVAFCGYRYRKRRDNTREGEAGPSNKAAHRQRRGKGTWPLNQEELAESKKLAAPRKSSLKVIPEGSQAVDAGGAGSSKAEVPKYCCRQRPQNPRRKSHLPMSRKPRIKLLPSMKPQTRRRPAEPYLQHRTLNHSTFLFPKKSRLRYRPQTKAERARRNFQPMQKDQVADAEPCSISANAM